MRDEATRMRADAIGRTKMRNGHVRDLNGAERVAWNKDNDKGLGFGKESAVPPIREGM